MWNYHVHKAKIVYISKGEFSEHLKMPYSPLSCIHHGNIIDPLWAIESELSVIARH